jgi:2-methylcitrate dehydratase PrpD
MHHAGATIWPAVLAMCEREDLGGRSLLEAAIVGYEASLRIGLATQPSMYQRGFMATPTCGALGAALAVGKLLGFDPQDLAGALGAASSYAGGLAQFYHSGSFIKRINGGRGAESGVLAALLTKEGIWGPRDILEGQAGFFRAFAQESDPAKLTGGLGREFRLMEVSTKAHAGAGRLQASADAALALGAAHALTPEAIVDVEVGINLEEFPPKWNIAPTDMMPITRLRDGAIEQVTARWGLIPYFSKDAKSGFKCINARAETVATSPAPWRV